MSKRQGVVISVLSVLAVLPLACLLYTSDAADGN